MLSLISIIIIASLFFAGSCAFIIYMWVEADKAASSSPVARLLKSVQQRPDRSAQFNSDKL